MISPPLSNSQRTSQSLSIELQLPTLELKPSKTHTLPQPQISSHSSELSHFSPETKMQSSFSLSLSHPTTVPRSNHTFDSLPFAPSKPINLRLCGLRREALGFSSLSRRGLKLHTPTLSKSISASLTDNGSPPKSFDYDLIIIGAGVGGHGAALHAVEKVIHHA